MFFEQYFKKRGESIEPNANNEVQVRCPFPHDKGTEDKNASASFNTKRRIYKCFTCTAEGREDGMSETSFVSLVFDTTYENAIKLRNMLKDGDTDSLLKTTELLLNNIFLMDYLQIERGFTVETIKRYKLGYTGDGIIYPVILEGMLFDTRVYNPEPQNGEPKIKSRKNATTLLFPYDEWLSDNRPTLLTAGEGDTLIGRQNDFNCVESTGGEGSVPKILLSKFKGKKVYIVYDCDEAGKKSALRMGFYLKDIGAEVYIVDLGLAGTKEDKDLTDYFVKHKKTAKDLQSLLDAAPLLTQEQYQEQKNKEFPLVDLWNIKQSRYSDKYISSRVMQMGHFELPLVDIPAHMEYECLGETDSTTCQSCPIALGRRARQGEWSLGSENLEDLMKLVEVGEAEQFKNMRSICGIPAKCPNSRIRVTAKHHYEKVILAPDVETESESSGYRAAELHAYVQAGETEDGNKYRMYFKRVPHPKDQSIMMIVDKVEDSDNAINAFRVTKEFMESMKVWQGEPGIIMKKRFEELGKVAVGKYLPFNVFLATELVYHGVLDFNFMGQYMKGHPEGLMIGASRTGKSEVGNIMCAFYGLGNVTECKNASVVGLIGGVDKNSNGTFRISWGEIPRNHKGLVFMDEISGLHPEVFKQLTGLRSQRKAVIAKIRKGEAPAKTRLLWVGNPRVGDDKRSRSLYDYATGVDVCLDLFPADEDISRFDYIVLVPEPAEYISPLNDDGTLPPEKQAPAELKQLIRWTWSRNKDQVIFEPYVQKYIEHVAIELEKDFGSSVKIIGVEGVKKIARIAVSVAACCYSTDDFGETVIVKKEHVDWVRDWLVSLYDNDIFRLKQYVDNQRKFNTTTPEVTTQIAGYLKKYPMIIRMLIEQPNCPHYNLKASGGIGDEEYRHVMTTLFTLGCIQQNSKGVTATRRLRSSIDDIRRSRPKKVEDPDKPKSFSDKIDLE